MKGSSRLTVGIHVLTLLALEGGEAPVTSELIASSVNTNPVVIRRLLGMLREANLVRSAGGPGGGWRLAAPAKGITLRDVFRVVEGRELFPLHAAQPNPRCPVGRTIQAALGARYDDARLALERELAHTTIHDLLEDVKALARS